MTKKLNSIMLIDDSKFDNFFHERVIKKTNCTDKIIIEDSAKKALQYLSNNVLLPDLIFLDINMPETNGWEFLQEYEKMHPNAKVIISMLTTSNNPEDLKKAQNFNPPLKAFKTKPLTTEILNDILNNYF